jgi:hypothetical protein
LLFCRTGDFADEFEAHFRNWNQLDEAHSALAYNLRYDDRVSEAREESLREVWNDVQKRDPHPTFRAAVEHYRKTRVYTHVNPEFLNRAKNGNNIPGGDYGVKLLPTGVDFVRVLDLHGLIPLFQKPWVKRSGEKFERFQDVPTSSPPAYSKWLSDNLDRPNEKLKAVEFLEQIFELINQDLELGRRAADVGTRDLTDMLFPTWVTVAEDLDTAAHDETLIRLAQILGVGFDNDPYPRWVCALRYSADRAGTAVRPTQLDAGANHLHFPSPGTQPAARGGHPMDLAPTAARGRLPREFIHIPIRLKPADLWKWGKIEASRGIEVVASRDRHLERLRAEYWPEPIDGWATGHISDKFRPARGAQSSSRPT